MRVKIEATGLFTYPDVTVACGNLRFEDATEDTLLNSKVIFEVLSESTVGWDRGQKFWHYRHLASLAEYVLVAQDGWLIEHYQRQPDGNWLLETSHDAKGVLSLRSIKCKLAFADIYANTGLKPGVLPPGQNPEPPRKR
jgi:Uma2 family endonuclease